MQQPLRVPESAEDPPRPEVQSAGQQSPVDDSREGVRRAAETDESLVESISEKNRPVQVRADGLATDLADEDIPDNRRHPRLERLADEQLADVLESGIADLVERTVADLVG